MSLRVGRPGAGRKARARAGFPLPPWLWLPRPSEQTRPGAGRRAGRLPSAPGRRNLGPGAGHEGGAQARTCPLPCPGSLSRPGNRGRSQRLELTPEHTDSSPGRRSGLPPICPQRWLRKAEPLSRGGPGRTWPERRSGTQAAGDPAGRVGAQGLGTAPLPAAHPPAAPPTSEPDSQSEPPGPPSSCITPPARPLGPLWL